jgi:hypothetical protein
MDLRRTLDDGAPSAVMTAKAARRSVGQGWRSTSPAASMRSASRVKPPLVNDTCAASSDIRSCPPGDRTRRSSTSNQVGCSPHSASRSF